MRSTSKLLTLCAVLALGVTRMAAQGCVQCATSAHAAGVQGERALFQGMLVLLLPSLAILCGLAVMAYRERISGPQNDSGD